MKAFRSQLDIKFLRHWFSCFCLILLLGACKKTTVNNPETPFSIQTHLFNAPNYIHNTFALPNNTLVIQTRGNNSDTFSTLFQYDSDLRLISTLSIPVNDISEPALEQDGTFTVVTFSYQTGYEAYSISNNLKVLKKRYIGHLYINVSNTARHPPKLSKLPNGYYLIGNNNDGDGAVFAKISLICVKDLFTNNSRLWSWVEPTMNRDWIENIFPDADNSFYISGYINSAPSKSFIRKFDASGKSVFHKYVNTSVTPNTTLNIEKDRLIFCERENFHFLTHSGDETGKEPILGNYYQPISNLVQQGEYYYYYKDVFTLDGQFIEVRKIDSNLKTVKSKLFGNQGTNNNSNSKRSIIQMSSGEMVLVCSIENPNLSGNQWLLVKINSELELVK